MVFLLQQTIRYMVPMMIVALAGVFAERSGIINLALEGIMIMGAFVCAVIVRVLQETGAFMPGTFGAQLSVVLGFVLAAVFGGLFSLLLSYASIKWKSDQTITGTALNLIAPAIVLFVANVIFNQNKIFLKIDAARWSIIKMPAGEGFFHDLLAIFFDRAYITTFLCVAIFVVLSIILYRTKFGLQLRACGEHPQAADSVGINVYKMRYLGTTISGVLAGIGGYTYALTIDGGSATGAVAGFGFLALAIMIFGNWKPLNIAIVSFVFGILKCLAAAYASIDINGDGIYLLKELSQNVAFFSSDLYNLLPYLVTLVVLAFTSKKSRAPKAEGIPYDKGQR